MRAKDIPYRTGPISEGDRFGRLTATAVSEIRQSGKTTRRRHRVFVCDCGAEKWLEERNVKAGNIRSCGCLAKDTPPAHKTHGLSRTRVYHIWAGMKGRCYDPTNLSYPRYGGRGITVCGRWLDSFENFFADMGHPPENHVLDRIDNDGNYAPDNCRWATVSQNLRNMKNNRIVKFQGRQMTMIEAIELAGINRVTFYGRLKRGMSIHDALTTPINANMSRQR